jgi:transcriptional regulator ATRX
MKHPTPSFDMTIRLRNKAIKFEKISLGDLIDLDLLERRSITDKDDAMAMKMEDAMEVCRTGSTRVVTRIAPLRALKAQARKECTESRLPRDTLEYKPRLPRQNNDVPATLPKAKKRAELQRLSTGLGSSAAESGRLSPTMMGLLIGDDTAEFMDSDFILKVENCTSKVTVCRPLAMLLKEHQKDGLKFCWKNVCSKIMSPKEKDNDEIHGAILAHNMGLGKSFQAVCLLHTLLTHPALITTSGRRVIRTALLIAPVNTLANWETEFQKWVGASSGRSIPGIRFYSWKETRSKLKLVKEWYSSGGIICVSTEKYAMACKDYLDVDKRNSNSKKANSKKSTTTIEDDAFLRKALFGPDIVVLDEVHTMLKSNSTIIYKVLGGLHTKLRLGLTG